MKIFNNTDGSTGNSYSSKGNQLKFEIDDKWYKADFLGYEGAAEYAVSKLLQYTNIPEYVTYRLEEISYNGKSFNGCVSANFLKEGQQLITAERLFLSYYDKSASDMLNGLSVQNKIKKFVDCIETITGLTQFGKYLTMLLELDALILNEDRHFHNIAVLQNADKTFAYCPVFDNGASFLSDIRNDYPLEKNIYGLIPDVTAKPFSKDFDEQLECCQKLYGCQLQIAASVNLANEVNELSNMYGNIITSRICNIFEHQHSLYSEFFVAQTQPLTFSMKK